MDISLILWGAAFTLFVIVVLQILYLLFLSYIPTRRTHSKRAEFTNSQSSATMRAAPNGPLDSQPAPAPAGYLAGSLQNPSNIRTPVPVNVPRAANSSQANFPVPTLRASTPTPAASNAAPAPLTATEIGKMVVIAGLQDQLELNLPGSEFSVGRFYNQERKILVVLDEKSVSREHALFQYNAQINQYFLTDKSSSYGTYVLINDQFQPLTPERAERIFNGDVVQFGNVVKVRFMLLGETRASVTQL